MYVPGYLLKVDYMTAIVPNSTIEFFGDVGLSPTYEDSRYFVNENQKNSFFDSLPKARVLTCTYQRENRNRVRVGLSMGSLYNKQYMRFKNTGSGFEDKWFYAFITAVDYINNVTTEVEYQIDYIMTWMGAFTLSKCYVERQHSTTDAVGDNIVEENLEIGDYVHNWIRRTGYLNSTYQIIIGASVDQQGESGAGGELINNIYSGVYIHRFGTAGGANSFIDDLTGKAQDPALVGAVMFPSGFAPVEGGGTTTAYIIHIPKQYPGVTGGGGLDGYNPRNKKLFTYPYNFLSVTNGEGNFATLRYEFFNTPSTEGINDCLFSLYAQPTLQPEVILEPMYYKTHDGQIYNTAEKMSLKGFPQCAFNIDQYKAFLAQNSSSLAADAIATVGSGIISTGANVLSGNFGGALQSALGAGERIMMRQAKLNDYSRKPPQANGTTTGDIEAGRKLKDFYFYSSSITYDYARIIDDFFDMFGYAQNRLMVPNMAARPSWTYVKTAGCIVHCDAPAEDVREIEAAFDRGIRFWTSGVAIGNYNASNVIV